MKAIEDLRLVGSPESLKSYLSEALGYRVEEVTYQPDQLHIPPRPAESIRSASLLCDYHRAFQIYLFEVSSLNRTTIRSILEPFYRHHPAGDYLFVFTKDYSELAFVSPERILRPGKPAPTLQLRILPVEPQNVYHTDLEVLRDIRLERSEQDLEVIRRKHQEAFSIERVTAQFFKDYKGVLAHLKEILARQGKGTPDQVHGFAQQLLNRLMFLYFLQKKGWLKWDGSPDKRYLRTLWGKYRTAGRSSHGFYNLWLDTLFFYVFNHPFGARPGIFSRDLPPDVKTSFATMPFLNGGLFARNDLDRLGFEVPDEFFSVLFDEDLRGHRPGFLERYNFTVREDEPLEVEVAVDPEMLGKVYESLINEEDRHQAGIFYTPRIEIAYMCRLSIIEYLHDVTGLSKDVLIPFVMEPESEETQRALTNQDLARIHAALEGVRVVDPAVGSGSFLVGMMSLLVRLYKAMSDRLGRKEDLNEFALKKRIISQNLYGVDVKDWAVRVCELRLWLSLIIESDESQMDIYGSPLLPNLTFKVRQGDSLVEEVAGVPLSLRADYAAIPPPVKRRIGDIVEKKADYFAGNRAITREEIEKLEHQLLREVLDSKIKALDSKIRALEAPDRQAFQHGLEEIRQGPERTDTVLKRQAEARAKVQPQIDALRREKERLQQVAASVGKKGDKDYFLWDIDFAEVFLEKHGFDIVIGNPPYVRQEEIGPPLESPDAYEPDDWRARKRAYKEQLERAVRTHWGTAVRKIDKKSDLYVYFYYLGLALLRPGGLFCFINSNSWLDVGYGASLQEFLLRNITIRYVVDNHARRSFKESDINTVIVLLQRAPERRADGLRDQVCKFVAFKVPFEAAVNSDNLQLIELANDVESGDEFRVYPIRQGDLWLDGVELSEEGEAPSLEMGLENGRYVGGKWGGKYLRAPDIFFTILQKGKRHLASLGKVAHILTVSWSRQGENSNLMISQHGVPATGHLTEVLKSPKDVTTIPVKRSDTLYWLRLDSWVRQHIEHAPILWVDLRGDKHICHRCLEPVAFTHNFHGIRPFSDADTDLLCAVLNSTLCWLFVEVLGRRGLGGGAVRVLVEDLRLQFPVVIPSSLAPSSKRRVLEAFKELCSRPTASVLDEITRADRKALDEAIFEELGLTEGERRQVYGAVAELVQDRLAKARSLHP